jgi:quercetin dioxygenase-like cupin family protein
VCCFQPWQFPWQAVRIRRQPQKGFDIKVLGSIDLGPEIDGMAGRVLRTSYVTVAPGGGLAAHSHDGRPEIIYVVQGILTEERNGGRPSIINRAMS